MREVLSFRRGRVPRTLFRISNVLFMTGILTLMFVPLLKVLSDSLDKSSVYGLRLWPRQFSVDAYTLIFTYKSLYKPLLVSFITTIGGTSFGLAITTLGAYVLRQRKLFGRAFISKFVFITMIFNGGLVPTFMVLKTIGLTNTLWAVILLPAVNVFNMIMMRNFFEQIPESLFESAEMDGASPPQVFFRIVLPLSTAALASIGLFFAVQYWNDFFHFVVYITSRDLFNFQIKLRELVLNDQNLNEGTMVGYGNTVKNASIIVAMIPFFIMYPFAQKYFTTGVTMGAVKE